MVRKFSNIKIEAIQLRIAFFMPCVGSLPSQTNNRTYHSNLRAALFL